MRMILLSLNVGVLKSSLSAGDVVGFVPTAGDVYDAPYFVRDDRRRLVRLGYEVQDIDVKKESPPSLETRLSGIGALFIAGGNIFYLMQQLRENHLTDVLVRYLRSDRLYIGASAGAGICGPSLQPYMTLDDPKAAPRLTTLDGLGVTDFVVLPHYGKMKYLDKYHEVMKEHCAKYRMVPLRDDEALVVLSRTDYEVRRSDVVSPDIDGVEPSTRP